MQLIFHVTGLAEWEAATSSGEYRQSTPGHAPADVDFIHCSSADQVEAVANDVYWGAERLVVLSIDMDRVGPPIRYEDLAGGEDLFPHIYGPLDTAVVVAAQPLEPGTSGRFRFPVPHATGLDTDRLVLRELEMGDVDALHAILGDEATMSFDQRPWSRRRVTKWIARNRASYAAFGFGIWALILKQTGELVGECGLSWRPVGYAIDPEREIAWHVRRDLWHSGLATEAAAAVLGLAREMPHSRRTVVLTSPDNLPAQAVARALDMEFDREDVLDGKLRLVFARDL